MTTATEKSSTREMAATSKQAVAGAEALRSGPVFVPAVDIVETEEAIVVNADLPGVRADDLTIDLRDNTLTIEAPVTDPSAEGERLLLREYETGAFRREFRITNTIDQPRIDAALEHGVLRLTLPKAEKARPRKIAVRTA